jgi:hypothetical protein
MSQDWGFPLVMHNGDQKRKDSLAPVFSFFDYVG